MRFIVTYEGEVHELDLDEGVHLVGRSPGTEVNIPVRTVSGRHAELKIEGEKVLVRDLDSTNGTDIDGRRIRQADGFVPLETGQTVRFAGVALWREHESSVRISADTPVPSAADPVMQTTFRPDQSVMARSSFQMGQEYSDRARARISQMLSSLFELVASDAGAGARDQACGFVKRWVDADRVVLLEDEGEGTLPTRQTGCWPAVAEADEDEERAPMVLSRSLLRQVTEKRHAVLVGDVGGEGFDASKSMMQLNLSTVMAAPLFDNERVRGVLYVDTSRPGANFTEDDLQVLIATANAVAVKLRLSTFEDDLKKAARIQHSMLPDHAPELPGWSLLAHQRMCRGVGGDLYHFLPRKHGHWLLVLGDVTGKGMPAALAMSSGMSLLSMAAELVDEMDRLGEVLHRKLFECLSAEQFITLFAGELDPVSGELTYLNAGHDHPLLARAQGELEELPSAGMPMGLLPMNPLEVLTARLEPGDLMAIFSDGIPEATQDGESFLGRESLEQILVEMRTEPLEKIRDRILQDVDRYLAGRPASDDVTLMLVRREAE